MKSISNALAQFQLASLVRLVCVGLLFTPVAGVVVADEKEDANKAWAEVQKSSRPPAPPEAWRTKQPTKEEIEAFREEQKKLVVAGADKARDFYKKYPKHDNAGEARKVELQMLGYASRMGATDVAARIEALEAERLKDPTVGEVERFRIRSQAVQRAAMAKQPEGMSAVMAEYEKGVRQLMTEFPKNEEVYEMLAAIATNSEGEKAQALGKEILASAAPDAVKERVRTELKKMEAVGKPLNISFTAVDGREVSIASMKGKVILVDFWATWCGPCVAELPNVKAAYSKLHPKGFEIVGISFDDDKEALTGFVKKQEMPWPQYFDGKGWENKFGQEFGIRGIPAMWLVDKKGILRDMSGRSDLEAKVEKLLAE